MTKITRKALMEAVGPDALSFNKKEGTWRFMRGFFYTGGFTADKWMEKVTGAIKKAGLGNFVVLENGEVWKPFRGGASIRSSSHWFVTVAFTGEETPQ